MHVPKNPEGFNLRNPVTQAREEFERDFPLVDITHPRFTSDHQWQAKWQGPNHEPRTLRAPEAQALTFYAELRRQAAVDFPDQTLAPGRQPQG